MIPFLDMKAVYAELPALKEYRWEEKGSTIARCLRRLGFIPSSSGSTWTKKTR